MNSTFLPVEWPDRELEARMLAYRQASLSEATKRVILKVWRAFEDWCRFQRLEPLPCAPDVLARYLVSLADRGLKPATIGQAVYGVGARHRLAGLQSPGNAPEVRATLAGIRRSLGVRRRQAAALTIEHVRRIVFPGTMIGRRDRALLYVAVVTGLRGQELVNLCLSDIEPTDAGYRVLVRRSKTDQEGKGKDVEIVQAKTRADGCPVAILTGWLADLRSWGHARDSLALFPPIHRTGVPVPAHLSVQMVRTIVRKRVLQLGLDPAAFSAHSTRAGCATYLLDKGVPLNIVADHLRHTSVDVTRRYDRNRTSRALEGVY